LKQNLIIPELFMKLSSLKTPLTAVAVAAVVL
jgi:hypothetical protein